MHRLAALAVLLLASVTLPNGWTLEPAPQTMVSTGTMPQGMALSPDGKSLAVVESGFNPPALTLYRIPNLSRIAVISLPGALGRPVWIDSAQVLVAGANADALLVVDTRTRRVRRLPLAKGSYPAYVAASSDRRTYAVASTGDNAVRIGTLSAIGRVTPVRLGGFPAALAFGTNGKSVFATVRSSNTIVKIDAATSRIVARQTTKLHPSGILLSNDTLYVTESDADSVGIYAPSDLRGISRIPVGDDDSAGAIGVSPNAISQSDGTIFVTLAAANSVAVIRGRNLVGRMQSGWYPTDAVASNGVLYVLNGKGEGSRPNPLLRPGSNRDYIGAIEFGSLRAYRVPAAAAMHGSPQGAASWNDPRSSSVIRPHGPIRHVFFVLKENRSYDQVLGDMAQGNGDPQLTWFGHNVTPNEHAIASRFGLFDNAYASGEVSAAGHWWADAAFANDYIERFWPGLYGGRGGLEDTAHDLGSSVPSGGFLWDAAARAGVSFRDFGELVDPGKSPSDPWVPDVPSLRRKIDSRYAGWNLDYSDLDRVEEWRRDFNAGVRDGTLPAFEFIWLPNDHTYGSKAGKLTPTAYVAQNDYAFGRIVDTLSHSKVWPSSVLFAIEDDAQDGPDHVSDQRTTLFVASPYARGGVNHDRFNTVSIVRTIEVVLGMKPLSTYDAMAAPMYSAFTSTADLHPYEALAPRTDVTRRNSRTAYGAEQSAHLDFSKPDAIAPATLNRILSRNH